MERFTILDCVEFTMLRKGYVAMMRSLSKAIFRERENDHLPCQIEEGLFLGSLTAALKKIELERLNITHVLIVSPTISPTFENSFKYKVIPVVDRKETNIAQHFDECFDFIEEAKRMQGGVLVHCRAGISRSVTIVVAYLMKRRGMSYSQALRHVRSKRLKASPNAGFIKQLQEFEKSLSDTRNALHENSLCKADELQDKIVAKDDGTLGGKYC